jgi:hypothetical protein
MHGPSPFISKLMGLFFSMDAMVGEKYEEGLASLKAIAENKLYIRPADLAPKIPVQVLYPFIGVVDPAANLSPGSVESRGDNNSKPLRGKYYATQ